jgi:methylenetetrahydrofolate dehydrogenase (NADP+)/methenyltetrahydrofolate cyclohydrolase
VTATIIDGQPIAQSLREQAAEIVRQLHDAGHEVRLDAVMVGEPAAGSIYARSQQIRCEEVGISYKLHTLPGTAREADIVQTIHELNADPAVTGIMLNLPLPEHIDTPAVQYHIDPYKDVEGVNPANIGLLFYDTPIIAPCTAVAVLEILRRIDCAPRGLDAVVVGQGAIAGRPISLFLQHELATVTTCHEQTRDLQLHTKLADLLVVAVGKPHLIGPEHVKRGAIVIDVGINRITDDRGGPRTVGDVRFEKVADVASAITPVPGGVGPVTVAAMLRSATQAARSQLGPRRIEQ